MNRAPVGGNGADDEDDEVGDPALRLPQGTRNYITPRGHARLRGEVVHLLRV